MRLGRFDPADAQLLEEAEDLRQMARRFRDGIVTEADAKYLYQRSYSVRTSRGGGEAISRVGRESR